MTERVHYSRVYWSIVDDPKFSAIYGDDRHLATWLRMLLVADQAHPSSAHVPAGCRSASVRTLAECGLVDLVTPTTFRIHGLDAERSRRRDAAKRDPKGSQPGPKPDPIGTRTGRASGTEHGPKDEDEVEDEGIQGVDVTPAPRPVRLVDPVTA